MQVRASNRVEHTYTQHLGASPAAVFPLLCPVREVEWVNGWAPTLVLSDSGVAEEGCVFVTAGPPTAAVWVITRHDPVACHLEMVKLMPTIAGGRITIDLAPEAAGTAATVTYAFTSLGRFGDEVLGGFTRDHFTAFMTRWERELNHFLAHGTPLVPGPAAQPQGPAR